MPTLRSSPRTVICNVKVTLNHSNFDLVFQAGGAAEPFEIYNAGGASEFFLTCEHAGRLMPAYLGDLGISADDLDRHIAYDVGAEGLARRLASLLDAPLVLQRFSRLVVDSNRPFESEECIVEVSDGTVIAGNVGLTAAERNARFRAIHVPFHDAIFAALEARQAAGRTTTLVSVHSFTPRMRHSGEVRLFELGVLANRAPAFADLLLAAFQSRYPDVPAGRNVPYDVDDLSDYTIPVHGEKRGIAHALVEVRSDGIENETGQDLWARRLADALVAAAAK